MPISIGMTYQLQRALYHTYHGINGINGVEDTSQFVPYSFIDTYPMDPEDIQALCALELNHDSDPPTS